MNSKRVDLVRKRNIELSKQIEDLMFKMEFDSQLNMEGYKRAKDLITDLESIKSRWLNVVEDLEEKRDEYSHLISELKMIRDVMTSVGFKVPLYKKAALRLQKK